MKLKKLRDKYRPELEALERAMQSALDSWKNILTSMKYKNLDRQSILNALTSAEDDLFSLSMVSQGAMHTTESSIESLAVSDEYKKDRFQFCFVRRPYEWYRSFWCHRVRGTIDRQNAGLPISKPASKNAFAWSFS